MVLYFVGWPCFVLSSCRSIQHAAYRVNRQENDAMCQTGIENLKRSFKLTSSTPAASYQCPRFAWNLLSIQDFLPEGKTLYVTEPTSHFHKRIRSIRKERAKQHGQQVTWVLSTSGVTL